MFEDDRLLEIMTDLKELLESNQYEKACQKGEMFLSSISDHSEETGEILDVKHLIGKANMLAGKYNVAEAIFKGILEKKEKVTEDTRIKALIDMGTTCYLTGRLDEAGKYGEEALDAVLKTDDMRMISTCMNNLSNVCRDQGNLSRAINLLERALKIDRNMGDKAGEAAILENLAAIYMERNETEKSLEYLTIAIDLERECRDEVGLASSLGTLGYLHWHTGDSRAIDAFTESIEIYERLGIKDVYYGSTLVDFTEFLLESREFEIVKPYLEKARNITEETESDYLLQRFTVVKGFIHQKKSGSIDKAIECYQKAIDIAKNSGLKTAIVEPAVRMLYLLIENDSSIEECYNVLEDAEQEMMSTKPLIQGHMRFLKSLFAILEEKYTRAEIFMKQSRSLFEKIGRDDLMSRTDTELRRISILKGTESIKIDRKDPIEKLSLDLVKDYLEGIIRSVRISE